MTDTRTQRLRSKPFTWYVLLLALLIAGLWIYLWNGLASYERGLPSNLMEGLVEELKLAADQEATCEAVLKKYDSRPLGNRAERDGVLLAELVGGKNLSNRRMGESEDGSEQYYALLADGEEVAKATLSVHRSGIFGMDLYGIDRVGGLASMDILAPEGMAVYAYGEELPEQRKRTERAIPEHLHQLLNHETNGIAVPEMDVYELGELFHVPDVYGVDASGREVQAVQNGDGSLIVGRPMSAELLETLHKRAVTLTQKYSYYMSDNLVWGGFRRYIVSTAPVYDRLRTLEVYWYTLHDSTRFENMELGDWILYTDELVSLRMQYDFIVVGQGKVTTYPTDLTYYLAKESDGEWRIAEMIVN